MEADFLMMLSVLPLKRMELELVIMVLVALVMEMGRK